MAFVSLSALFLANCSDEKNKKNSSIETDPSMKTLVLLEFLSSKSDELKVSLEHSNKESLTSEQDTVTKGSVMEYDLYGRKNLDSVNEHNRPVSPSCLYYSKVKKVNNR